MSFHKFSTLMVLLTLSCSCVAGRSGETSIRVQAADRNEEIQIRRQEWIVEKVMQDVLICYEMEDLNIDVLIEDDGGLGAR
jgi:hypothetical protein